MAEQRPIVDLAKLSFGSLRRYQALYGVEVDNKVLLDGVKSHFGSTVYSMMRSNVGNSQVRFTPQTEISVKEDHYIAEIRQAIDAVDHFLKVKRADKDESAGLRRSSRRKS